MAQLFTRTDVERAARLATLHRMVERDPEVAIAKAVATVCEEGPLFYSEEEVRQMLQFVLHQDDVEDAMEEALRAIGRD